MAMITYPPLGANQVKDINVFSPPTASEGVNSSKLKYSPAGTGAVDRDLQSWLRGQAINVVDYGYVADNATDNRAAIANAVARGLPLIFPPGIGRITNATPLAITVPCFFQPGAILNLIAGTSVTFSAPIQSNLSQIFVGSGSCILAAGVDRAFPEWFGATVGGLTNAAAIARCVTACRATPTLVWLSQTLSLEGQVNLYPDVTLQCAPGVNINGGTGAAYGFVFTPGNYLGRKYYLGLLSGFTGRAIWLQGCSLLDVECEGCQNNPFGVYAETNNASYPNLLDNRVYVHYIAQCNQSAFTMLSDNSACVMQGNEFSSNFCTANQRTVYYYSGATSPSWDGNLFDIKAIDPNVAFSNIIEAISGSAVTAMIFKCESWLGGVPATGTWITGGFNGSLIKLRPVADPIAWSQWAITGTGNRFEVDFGWGDSTTALVATTTINNRAGFNGGLPTVARSYPIKWAAAAWASGATQVVYMWHPFALPGSRMTYRPISMPGVTVTGFTTTANTYEIAMTLRNTSGAAITADITWSLEMGC